LKQKQKTIKPVIEKEDVKKITSDDFDSVIKTILFAPPQTKKKKNEK